MKNFRENKGITLIALIITIIVLLIIAGISISGGIDGIDKAHENRLMSDLEKVQHAITERYTKFELTKDTSVIVGTKVDLSSLTDVPESINWKVFQVTQASETSTHPERKYYRLGKSDLENLGLTGEHKSSSYIVNYYSGEVYDETERQTTSGTVLYKSAIENEASELGDDIITDGLLVYYDAINNTGTGHSNTTTVWKDLSGNGRDGKMTDVTMGNNYAQFNGTSSWVNMGEINSDYQTVELTFSTNKAGYQQSVFGNWETGGGGISIVDGGYIYGTFYIRNKGAKEIISDIYVANNKIYNVILTFNGEKDVLYVNGIEKGTNDTNATGVIKKPDNDTIFAIGGNPHGLVIGGNKLRGKVYDAKIYNRALSASEVKQNYIVEKNRYGIEE